MVPVRQVRLEVYEAGTVTVVGFGGAEIHDQVDIGPSHDDVVALVRRHRSQTVAFDLSNVRLVPSGLLGLFDSLRTLGAQIVVYNPSRDIRDVLEITRLKESVTIRDIEI